MQHSTWKEPSNAAKSPCGLSKGAFTLITLTVHSVNVNKMSNLQKAGDHMTYQATLILGKCQIMKLFFFQYKPREAT